METNLKNPGSIGEHIVEQFPVLIAAGNKLERCK